eukprot:TRINITY_DN13764_c0_g2_i2.p1 TRINITY_DN13764_c0_g2~~TRINITY_DN13764_c0_g2_i2.p1  ORF type:complete len:653 (-),score=131.93 TRINITY_DN13764_c0_g2_i2:102-2060(-)
MTRSGQKPPLWFAILALLAFVGWAPTDFLKHGTTHRRGAVRLAAAGETWWCQHGGINGKLKDCFEENMQTDGVPLLKDYDTYQASLPVRERGISQPLKLHQLQFFVRDRDLDVFAARLAANEQRPTVAYIAAASHSGKSASVVVGFLRSRELNTDCTRLDFTHYLYMPFANNGGNYHRKVSEAKLQRACGEDVELREALGAAYMKDCFKAQAFDSDYVDVWHLPNTTPTFRTAQKLLEKDVSTFMQRSPKGVLLVHVDEHGSMCPDPDFRRGAMRVLAELPGVQVLATYTDIPPLPKQKSSETCRRPIACLLPDVEAIMKERLRGLPMDDIDMRNEAILLRVATLRVTFGLALQKLLLAGLHIPSSELDRLLNKLENMLGNAGDNVKARLEKCIEHCNRMWMEDSKWQRKSLTDLLCGIDEDDDRVQEKRFPQVVALDDIITAPLEVLLRDRDEDQLSPANKLHRSCQRIFKQALKTSPRAAVTAGKILEYAYLWVLACNSCKFSELEFDELEARFQCQDIQPGYIFQKKSKRLDFAKVAEMQNATLYYAEGNHPCADIFFKDDSGALYLVDVGGTSNMSKALNKVRKMSDVLIKEGSHQDLQVRGVVLLPNIGSISQEDVGSISEAITVTGARARRLLGGLAQLLTWLPAV